MTEDIKLFKQLHMLPFIKEIEAKRLISNNNLEMYNLDKCDVGNSNNHVERDYIYKRPLHLFGIEIENQKNPKHLMGDFLNAISLSRIPIVVVPESKLSNVMKMLMYNSTIKQLKDVPIYDLLKTVNILTISQFRNLINELVITDDIDPIHNTNYH